MKRAVAIAAGMVGALCLGAIQAQAGAGLAPNGLKRAVIDYTQATNPARAEKAGYRYRRYRRFRRFHRFQRRRHYRRRYYRRHYGYYGYGYPSYRSRYYYARPYYRRHHYYH